MSVSVPSEMVVMLSIQLAFFSSLIKLYVRDADGIDLDVWNKIKISTSIAYVFKTQTFRVWTYDPTVPLFCREVLCDFLHFSFHPDNNSPQKLPSGLFNCSVGHYSSFQHHLDCNLKMQCEDGRDESEHCPFSSPECLSGVPLCNRCYVIITKYALHQFDHSSTSADIRAKEYCGSIGGTLGIPKCEHDWRKAIANSIKRPYWGLWERAIVGLYFGDMFLPNMYRYNMISLDRTVLYHASWAVSKCHKSSEKISICAERDFFDCYISSFSGAICELPRIPSRSEGNYRYNKGPSLTNTGSVWHINHPSLTTCSGGQVTHSFLLCGFQQFSVCGQDHGSLCTVVIPVTHTPTRLNSKDHHVISVPTFMCEDHITTVSYTLVCDFRPDCEDKSDESFCQHPPCDAMFTCTNGQCVSYEDRCDQISHCLDNSDEAMCNEFFKMVHLKIIPSAFLINFNGVNSFVSTPMKYNESCPDTHYRCPSKFNDCLPVYTRCNGMYDCLGHEDEEGCQEMNCPGFFQCRDSRICVHGDHVCDGWPHCPLSDDEMLCRMTYPDECVCQGHTFFCFKPFFIILFPQIRYLNATGSGMKLSAVSNLSYLISLVLVRCSLTFLPDMKLSNLRFLDLADNRLQYFNVSQIMDLNNLRTLSLSNNPLTKLHRGSSSAAQQSMLTELDLSYTTLTLLDTSVLSAFWRLQKLHLSFTDIHTVSHEGFRIFPHLTEVCMDGSPLKTFPSNIFKGLSHLKAISTQNYKLCCQEILPHNFDAEFCYSPKDEISSCEDLLISGTYRWFLWLISFLSVTGNVFCFVARLCARKTTSSSGFSVFVTNLTMADFLMGFYIVIIGVADEMFRGRYLHFDDTWKNSVACKVAGFLSLLSSEASALIVWLITLDRFIVLCFPFSTYRFERTSAAVVCLLTWLVGWFLAVLPLLPMTAHWEFYSETGICIPLPVTRQEFKGRIYSLSVLIVLNFILFLLISSGQAFIYWSIQKNSMATSTRKASRDMTIARRLISVAMTDFMCWFPIGVCGMLSLARVPIPGEVNVALAIFILPLNSAINPFMYTFNTLAEKRRESNEAKLLKFLESHVELLHS